VIARIEQGKKVFALKDAMADEAFCRELFRRAVQPAALKNPALVSVQTRAAADKGISDDGLSVEFMSGEQSNTSVRFGKQYILKLYRRLESGVNPDFEVTRYLTEHTSFDRAPKLAGGIELAKGHATLVTLQEYLANQGDGWSRTLDELSRFYERALSGALSVEGLVSSGGSPEKPADDGMPPSVRDAVGTYLYAAGLLGRRTAEMHRALGQATEDPAFRPEPFGKEDAQRALDELRREAESTVGILEKAESRLPQAVLPKLIQAKQARDHWRQLRVPDAFAAVPKGRCRVHGDYHLGQVLWSNNDFYILDFEGEPARTLAERRRKQSPLKDVAGMIRSFHYASYAGMFKAAADRPSEANKLEPAAKLWFQWTVWIFLKEYRQAAAGSELVPPSAPAFEFWLSVFLMEKALYEVMYEFNNRPSWIGIPLEGLLSMIPPTAQSASR